ncbi:MAG: hypothetical protein EA387_16420 [Nitriliruptor sp.]|nr:MAG: hypothetical protein EA387_16420 [Nitriliruptor sp.]
MAGPGRGTLVGAHRRRRQAASLGGWTEAPGDGPPCRSRRRPPRAEGTTSRRPPLVTRTGVADQGRSGGLRSRGHWPRAPAGAARPP